MWKLTKLGEGGYGKFRHNREGDRFEKIGESFSIAWEVVSPGLIREYRIKTIEMKKILDGDIYHFPASEFQEHFTS